MAMKDSQNIWDLHLSHFRDLLPYVKSVANIVPLLSNQALPHIPYLIIFLPLNLGNSINLLACLTSVSLPWRPDFFGFTEPPTAGYREQGSHHPRAHWFIFHCYSDTWYRCSYAPGVPVLAMAYLDIVEAHPEVQPLPKAICLPSKQDWQWICIEWRNGLFA